MKHLNRSYPKCGLNVRLRAIYNLKQQINNTKMDPVAKAEMMKECDKQINRCWRLHYEGHKGYSIR